MHDPIFCPFGIKISVQVVSLVVPIISPNQLLPGIRVGDIGNMLELWSVASVGITLFILKGL